MRVPPWALLVGGLLAIAALIVVAVIAAGGDDNNPSAATGTPTPTRVPDDAFGQPPTMTAHIHRVAPEHAGAIPQALTIESPNGGRGVCAEVSYEDLPQNNLMFQMALDGQIVTDKLVIRLLEGTNAAPERGLICYGTEEGPGLALGKHDAAVAVQDPNNLSGPPSEVVAWKFEVIE